MSRKQNIFDLTFSINTNYIYVNTTYIYIYITYVFIYISCIYRLCQVVSYFVSKRILIYQEMEFPNIF